MKICIDFVERYNEQQIKDLQTLHTKQLLKKKDISYARSEMCLDCCCHCEECDNCQANERFNRDQIKAVLATREHVLNKQEAKALRKQRIKEGR